MNPTWRQRFWALCTIILVSFMSVPGVAQEETAQLRELGNLWVTSGVGGRFAEPVCVRGHELEPASFARYAQAVQEGMAQASNASLFDTGGLLAPNGIARFSAERDPAALAELVVGLGYRALAFGESDLGVWRSTLLPVYQELRAAGVPVVASNLRCDESAQPLCEQLVGPEDGIAMFDLGEERVAFLAVLSPEALTRVTPQASARTARVTRSAANHSRYESRYKEMSSPTHDDEQPFAALMAHKPATKKPRGRPPAGAVWREGGYVLPPESVEIAAQKVMQHRQACRDRYKATRDALRAAKPELFRNNVSRRARGSLCLTEFPVCSDVQKGAQETGDTGADEGRRGVRQGPLGATGRCTAPEV